MHFILNGLQTIEPFGVRSSHILYCPSFFVVMRKTGGFSFAPSRKDSLAATVRAADCSTVSLGLGYFSEFFEFRFELCHLKLTAQ